MIKLTKNGKVIKTFIDLDIKKDFEKVCRTIYIPKNKISIKPRTCDNQLLWQVGELGYKLSSY